MKASFRNLLKLCRFSRKEKDDQRLPVQQVEYMGKAVDVVLLMPYGSHANIPPDFIGTLLQISTQEQNRVVIPMSFIERPKPIESGEVVYFHPVTGSKIHFKNNGDIDITTEDNVNVKCKNLKVTATEDIIASCVNVSVTATTKATVVAPAIDLTGNVVISGTLSVAGASTLAAVTSNGKNIGDTHEHTQGTDSNGDTQANISGVI